MANIIIKFEGVDYTVDEKYNYITRDKDGSVHAHVRVPLCYAYSTGWDSGGSTARLGTSMWQSDWRKTRIAIEDEITIKERVNNRDTLSVFSETYSKWLESHKGNPPLTIINGEATSEVCYDIEVTTSRGVVWLVLTDSEVHSILLDVDITYKELYRRITSCDTLYKLTPTVLDNIRGVIWDFIKHMEEDLEMRRKPVGFDNFEGMMR